MNEETSVLITMSIILFLASFSISIYAGMTPVQSFIWNVLSSLNVIYYTLPLNFASNPLIFAASIIDVFVFVITAVWLAGLFFSYVKTIDFSARINTRRIKKLSDHIIVTPYNDLSEQIIRAANDKGIKSVVITDNEKAVKVLENEKIPVVKKEPDSIYTLYDAGINKAKYLIICGENDTSNILISISAKAANRSINIISRASESSNISHMVVAGVYKTIIPEETVAKKITNELVKNLKTINL